MEFCKTCGDEITEDTKSKLCRSCAHIARARRFEVDAGTIERRFWYGHAMLNRWTIATIAAAARRHKLEDLAGRCPIKEAPIPFDPHLPLDHKGKSPSP